MLRNTTKAVVRNIAALRVKHQGILKQQYVIQVPFAPVFRTDATYSCGYHHISKGSDPFVASTWTIRRYVSHKSHASSRESSLKSSHDSSHESSLKSSLKSLSEQPGWTEVFGSLAEGHVQARELKEIQIEQTGLEDEEDGEPYRTKVGRRNTPIWYGKQMGILAKKGQVYECLELLQTMLKEDRVPPTSHVFTVAIGAVGRVGYVSKAMSLFKKMRQYGLEPEDPTYTALFNAFSNGPDPEPALELARLCRAKMVKTNHQPNQTTYKAMIKTFGKCGDIQTAFSLVDEMVDNNLRIDGEVICMLLMACISDKQAGLRYAIEVWRRMKRLQRKRKLTVDAFHYNLLLRSVRDCQAGDPLLANQLLDKKLHDQTPCAYPIRQETQERLRQSTENENILPERTGDAVTVINSANDFNAEEDISMIPLTKLDDSDKYVPWWKHGSDPLVTRANDLQKVPLKQNKDASVLHSDIANRLDHRGNDGTRTIVGLINLERPENRLALFGGQAGVLDMMRGDEVSPDVKTFSLLMDLLPPSMDSEHDLLLAMKDHNVKPDVDFFNMLIRRRSRRNDYSGAGDVLLLITNHGLSPNHMTFGCLATSCTKRDEGMQLLKDIENCGFQVSVVVCNTLLHQSKTDFNYATHVMKYMVVNDIRPDEKTIRILEKNVQYAQLRVVKQERGNTDKNNKRGNTDKNNKRGNTDTNTPAKALGRFMKFYKEWLSAMKLEKKPGPWDAFRKPTPIGDDSVKPNTK